MKVIALLCFLCFISEGFAQDDLQQLLNKYNTNTIPYITVTQLAQQTDSVILLDARELKEYNVSKLKNAIHVGFKNFNITTLISKVRTKNQPIVVYCSLGVRSENIAIQLKSAGYTNVKNLYGGIFEWKNQNKTLVNAKDIKTDSIHAFSKSWSKWLKKGIKVYH